jgi:gluconate 2-dehydrogenase gamma chain
MSVNSIEQGGISVKGSDNSTIEEVVEKKLSRRDFLKAGAATLTVAAVAGVTACTTTTTATSTPTKTTTMTTTLPPTSSTTPAASASAEAYMFFNQAEAASIKAIFGRLIPGDSSDPGAVEAGAHIYLDHALAGFYFTLQQTYRRGLAAVDAYSQTKYKNGFASLTSTQQDAVLADMEKGSATGFYGPSATEFFSTLVKHVREGMFSDPLYGGNKNAVGWKMEGFPGAQVAYGDTDMAVGSDQTKRTIMTLADEEAIPMPMPKNGF